MVTATSAIRAYPAIGSEIEITSWSVGPFAIPKPVSTLSLLVIPGEWQITEKWRLRSTLLIQTEISSTGVLATTYLETQEYGWGNSEKEAVEDLLTSLVEYLESLEAREGRLGASSLSDLAELRRLFISTS